jgi:hypothetical protein
MRLDTVSSAQKSNAENAKIFPSYIYAEDINDSIQFKPIYLYNISHIEFSISRPPNFPRMLIKACPLDQEYIQVGSLTHPFIEFVYDEQGVRNARPVNGFREASRLLCPRNPGMTPESQDFRMAEDPMAASQGDNLNIYGVFWSLNNPPTREDLDKAKERLEITFKNELSKMASIEMESPANAAQCANRISHAAAEYFDQNTTWHKSDWVKKASAVNAKIQSEKSYKECPECGHDDIPLKAKKCFYQGCGWRFDQESTDKELVTVGIAKSKVTK